MSRIPSHRSQPPASTARRLVKGSTWLLLCQCGTFAVQLVYVAFTSRILSATDFGDFAIAIGGLTLVGVLIGGGIAPAIMRTPSVDRSLLSSMLATALAAGALGAVAIFGLGGIWAIAWGNEGAQWLVQASAFVVLFTPATALLGGYVRRVGEVHKFAVVGLLSTTMGCTAGGAVAWLYATPLGLIIGLTVVQVCQFGGYQLLVKGIVPRGFGFGGLQNSLFAAGATLSALMTYVTQNLGRFSVSRVFGAAGLGTWNRAESITTGPFYLVQSSLTYAIYPELRDLVRARPDPQRLSDLLSLLCWLTMPGAAVLAATLPAITPVLLGSGWDGVVPLAVTLAILGGVSTVASTLGSILEVKGAFSGIYGVQAGQILIQALFIALGAWLDSIIVVAVGLVVSQVARHLVQLWLAHRLELVLIGTVLRQYGTALVAAAGLCAVAPIVVWCVSGSTDLWIRVLLGIGLVITIAFVIFRWRHRLPPIKLCERYGILKSSAVISSAPI